MMRRISTSSGVVTASRRSRGYTQRISDERHAGQHHGDRQEHAHGQAAPQKTELRIRLAEEFAEAARQTVEQGERAEDEARSLEGAGAHQQTQQNKQYNAFEARFVELARMARQLQAVAGKHHGPGDVGRPSPQLPIDEIGEANKKQPKRR